MYILGIPDQQTKSRPGEPSPWLKILNETTRTRKPLPAGTLCTEHMCSRRREKQVDSCAMSRSVHSNLLPWFSNVTYFTKEPGGRFSWLQKQLPKSTYMPKLYLFAVSMGINTYIIGIYRCYKYCLGKYL